MASQLDVEGKVKKGGKKQKSGNAKAEKEEELLVKIAMLVVSLEGRVRSLESVVYFGAKTRASHWVPAGVKAASILFDQTLKRERGKEGCSQNSVFPLCSC